MAGKLKMASEEIVEDPKCKVYTLSKQEALDLIVYLAAQLANHPVPGNVSGAAPSINIVDRGQILNRHLFIIGEK